MGLVTNKDFSIGKWKIPNATDIAPDSDLLGSKTELSLFIEEYEKECLIYVLGYELYAELLTKLDTNESNNLVVGAEEKWDDLVNGKDNYYGLKKLVVPYIFFHYAQNDESHYSGVGEIKESAKGARPFSPRSRAVSAWREFYRYTRGDSQAPKAAIKPTIFGNIQMYDWYGTEDSFFKPLHS